MEPELVSADEWAAWIERKLSEPRDVRDIWSRLAPELAYGRHVVPPPADARPAAVLVLLYPSDSKWYLPLIERIVDTTVHSGQVSLPGGAIEPHESPEQAALREFDEELGISPRAFRFCGRLTPIYIYASNFLVIPCVAVAASRPDFCPSPGEVASLLELPVGALRDPARLGNHEIHRRGVVFRAPHIEFDGRRIWGATSMMLAELAALMP